MTTKTKAEKTATTDDAPKPAEIAKTGGTEAAKTPTTRPGTKQAKLIYMLRRKEGATIAEIVAETGWQAHTVRGAMSGALKKRLGLAATSEPEEGRGRVYRLPPA